MNKYGIRIRRIKETNLVSCRVSARRNVKVYLVVNAGRECCNTVLAIGTRVRTMYNKYT